VATTYEQHERRRNAYNTLVLSDRGTQLLAMADLARLMVQTGRRTSVESLFEILRVVTGTKMNNRDRTLFRDALLFMSPDGFGGVLRSRGAR
jgi:hypothetical protein